MLPTSKPQHKKAGFKSTVALYLEKKLVIVNIHHSLQTIILVEL